MTSGPGSHSELYLAQLCWLESQLNAWTRDAQGLLEMHLAVLTKPCSARFDLALVHAKHVLQSF